MKERLLRLAAVLSRVYLQFWPLTLGKSILWQQIVCRYIIWRRLQIVATTKFGARVYGGFPDVIHSYLYFFGVWEPGVTRLINDHLHPDDIVIDVGANIGAHSMLAASIVGAGGRVYAIEASPTIFKKLSRNVQTNGFKQVTILNVAVTDISGPVTVYLHSDENLGGSTILRDQLQGREQLAELNVEGRPLTQIIPDEIIRKARLIKIDVEGAEWAVIRGMRDCLESLDKECLLLLEANSAALVRYGVGLSDLLELFRSKGWDAFQIANPYNGEFYIRGPNAVLCTDIQMDAPLLDLGFCRPALLDELLAADRSAADRTRSHLFRRRVGNARQTWASKSAPELP